MFEVKSDMEDGIISEDEMLDENTNKLISVFSNSLIANGLKGMQTENNFRKREVITVMSCTSYYHKTGVSGFIVFKIVV